MRGFEHSDAAKRLSDTYNLHVSAARTYGTSNTGKWFAASLAEGKSDGVVYDSKQEAVRHQHHNENFYAFIKIGPVGMSICEAEAFLKMHRQVYDAGFRFADPDDKHGGYDVIPRLSIEDQLWQDYLVKSKTGYFPFAVGHKD